MVIACLESAARASAGSNVVVSVMPLHSRWDWAAGLIKMNPEGVKKTLSAAVALRETLGFPFRLRCASLGDLEMRTRRLAPLVAMAVLVAVAGCSKAPVGSADSGKPHRHHHHPPHDGTPVVLGDESYHIELVLNQSAGSLQAYVLDGEMENFVRSSAPRIEITATVEGAPYTLVLEPVPNPETGETVGDTSLFEAQADWLRTAREFDGVLKSIAIRGTTFADVKFNFPRGNDTDG